MALWKNETEDEGDRRLLRGREDEPDRRVFRGSKDERDRRVYSLDGRMKYSEAIVGLFKIKILPVAVIPPIRCQV